MLPGFGYRFLRQRRQHNGPSIDRGMTVIGRTISIVPDGARTIREKFRNIAAGRSESRVDARRRNEAGGTLMTSQFLLVSPGFDQGKRTFA